MWLRRGVLVDELLGAAAAAAMQTKKTLCLRLAAVSPVRAKASRRPLRAPSRPDDSLVLTRVSQRSSVQGINDSRQDGQGSRG